eukprot:9496474-Pyramimonas_sp.AAC.1
MKGDSSYLGPVSASPQICSTEMLNLAEVTSSDVVYDLGCGDALERGARGVGVELDDKAVTKAKESVEKGMISTSPSTDASDQLRDISDTIQMDPDDN